MPDMSKTIYKLQSALKQKGIIVCIHTSQFYSREQDRFIKMYRITKGNNTLIKTASQIKAVTVLNELWQGVKDDKGNK